jgi:glutathione synthase/RimK-type ligase-like ATP-grasp enzyme
MEWDGYDLDEIRKVFEGHGIKVKIVGIHEFDFSILHDTGKFAAICASSQEPVYKKYIQNVVSNLYFSGVALYPSLEHMMAHEDKAYQSIVLSKIDISSPKAFVFGFRDHAYRFLKDARYPLVGKTPGGYGSEGVCLIRNERDGRLFVRQNMFHRALRKGRSFGHRVFQRVIKPAPVLGLVIFQEFVPNLEGDWKILIWGDVACGVYRENRRDDFRASGSGKVRFCDIPSTVLEFTWDAMKKLDLPWGSFDIGFDGRICHLLEYQGLHFGLTAADKGCFYYARSVMGKWEKIDGRISIEKEMANIVINDFIRKGWLPRQAS